MTWADFYLICFAVGFALSLVSFLGGGTRWRLHLPHLPHGGAHLPVGVGHGVGAHAPIGAGHAPVAASGAHGVVVKGPAQSVLVREKEQVAGIWVNAGGMRYRSAPSFYNNAKRSRLRVVAMTRTPALTAIFSAAWP